MRVHAGFHDEQQLIAWKHMGELGCSLLCKLDLELPC